MNERIWTVYLSGEIHTDWRERIADGVTAAGLPVDLVSPVTDHETSDKCGVDILGAEEHAFWEDRKGASVNALRTRTLLADADLGVVRLGAKYPEWHGAFAAG